MNLTRTVAPTAHPVTLERAKVQCAVLFNDHDDMIRDFIAAAVDYLDGPSGVFGRAICTQTWQLLLPGWPDDLVLPIDPVSAAVVEYRAVAGGSWLALPSSNYAIAWGNGSTQALFWQPAAVPPDLAPDLYPVRLTLTCGYGAPDSDSIPPSIKVAILMLVDHWYRNRGVVVAGQVSPELEFNVSALIGKGRRHL